jgi:hypothetical protein
LQLGGVSMTLKIGGRFEYYVDYFQILCLIIQQWCYKIYNDTLSITLNDLIFVKSLQL